MSDSPDAATRIWCEIEAVHRAFDFDKAQLGKLFWQLRNLVDVLVNPPAEGVLRDVDTNGLASGNTLLEAVIHGLCEVIECDAIAQLEFVSLFADAEDPQPFTSPIDMTSLPDLAATLVEQLRREHLDVLIQNITADIGVATFRSVILDHDYPRPKGPISLRFPGWGCAANAKAALLRSLSESVQARMGFIQGARDSFNTTLPSSRSTTRANDLRSLLSEPSNAFASVPSFEADDLRDELRFLMNRVLDAGLERIIVCDLTRRDLDIPVVRVRVPGLSSFFVNRRRVGWRCLRHLL
jgi:ribosomal protein S12 methylthiotransferase accessory factor